MSLAHKKSILPAAEERRRFQRVGLLLAPDIERLGRRRVVTVAVDDHEGHSSFPGKRGRASCADEYSRSSFK